MSVFKRISTTLLSLIIAVNIVSTPIVAFAQEQPLTDEERARLEAELVALEREIESREKEIAELRSKGTSLKGEISSLNAKISKLNAQIKAVTLTLTRLNQDINSNQRQVTVTQQKIDLNRSAMADAIQSMYEQEQVSLMTILLDNPNLNDFFSDINNLMAVQDTLSAKIDEVNKLKEELLDEQEELVAKKSQATALKNLQDRQKQDAVSTNKQKTTLLEQTKGKETEYQKLVAQKKAEAAKIRSRIFKLLGGGEMTFEEAYDYAKFAEKATGVPAALLLAVLDRESALGKNVGRCSYKTAMAPGPPKSKRDDVTPFLQITAELGIDPEKQMVSCAISQDGAWGGAMGPAQFIPTTWMLYRDKISAITGNKPASPWRNADAFVGTALYLQNALAQCSAYSGGQQIKCAAARYYAGGNWSRYTGTYGAATLSRMQKFEDDIAAITA